MNACSILCASAWMLSAWLTALRKHERQHQYHMHTTSLKHRKKYILRNVTKWTATTWNCGCEWMLVRSYARMHECYQRDWHSCGNTNANTKSIWKKPFKSIERITTSQYTKILTIFNSAYDGLPRFQVASKTLWCRVTCSHCNVRTTRIFSNVLVVLAFETKRRLEERMACKILWCDVTCWTITKRTSKHRNFMALLFSRRSIPGFSFYLLRRMTSRMWCDLLDKHSHHTHKVTIFLAHHMCCTILERTWLFVLCVASHVVW